VHCILYEVDPVSDIAPFVYATDTSANGTYLKKSNSECAGSQGRGILMGQDNTFLLDDGDEVHISETVKLTFYSSKPIEQAQFSAVQEREKAIFAKQYLITGRLLGEGGYGKVLIGVDQETQRQLACKMIRLDHLYDELPVPNMRLPTGSRATKSNSGRMRWPTRVSACFREFDILQKLSHPNIVAIEKVFWSHNTIYIFQELVTGGDLFSFLEYKGGHLDNTQAAIVIRQVLIGVEYLHEQDIVHRDLKPDNILMTSLEDGARVVITDFGHARFLPTGNTPSSQPATKYQRMTSTVGTLEFTAPEIHRANRTIPADEGYSKSVDMWSIGCITAAVLTGDVIFTDRTHPEYNDNPRGVIMGLAARCDLSVLDEEYHPTWSEVGHRPKNFIKRLLVLDENERMTATEALVHDWFADEYYAEDLEDMYQRAIKGWKPRQKNLLLVERISNRAPDLTAIGLPGHPISRESVSRFFHPDEQRMTQNIMQTLSSSQHWRANTPLPAVADESEEDQLASQRVPPSYVSNHADHASPYNDETGSCGQEPEEGYGASQFFHQGQGHLDRHASNSVAQQDSSQHSPNYVAEQGMYHTERNEDDESYGSTESLNNVMDVAYSQHPNRSYTHPSPIRETPPSVLVQETPYSQLNAEPEQTQYPEEYGYEDIPADEQSSVIVRETPPDGASGHGSSVDNDLPTYHQWFDDEAAWTRTGASKNTKTYGKRGKLSRGRY
jgi:serine/threonine protein kinase